MATNVTEKDKTLNDVIEWCGEQVSGIEKKEAFRCLVWVSLSGGDGAEVEFAAGQVDHGAEVVHVLESAGSGLDVQNGEHVGSGFNQD